MWFMFVIPFIIFFIVFLMLALHLFRGHKHSKETMQNMVNTISAYAEREKQVQPVTPKEIEHFCEYCGSNVNVNDKKCASCGAKIKK